MLLVVALALLGTVSGAAPQAPSAAGQQATAKAEVTRAQAGTIRGRITAADTGAPIRRARVSVTASAASVVAVTDEEGRYTFAGLAPRRYKVSASRTPFVTMGFGQRHPNGPAKEIDLTVSPAADRIDITLPRGGVIAGRVTDDLGEPAAYIRVAAMRSRYSEGRRGLVPTGRIVTTDDLGQYRLAGLPPGIYYVGTTPAPADDAFNLAPSYFPGTQDPGAAARVSLRANSERQGVDFALSPGGLCRLRGTVVDDAGRPASYARVGLVSPTTGGVSFGSAVQPDGSFSLTNVSPGEYGLFASGANPDTGENDLCMMPLSINGDIDGISLTIGGGELIRGTVVTDSGARPTFAPGAMRLGAIPRPGTLAMRMPSAQSGVVRPDWTFDLVGVSGGLIVRPESLPDGWMLTQVLWEGRDVTDAGIEVGRGRPNDGLVVVLTNHATEIAGTVSDGQGKSIVDYSVLVFAESQERWGADSRFIATAQPDQQGRFVVKNLPPATYLAVALGFLEEGSWEDPEVLEGLRRSATKVTIGQGEHVAVTLQLVGGQ
jgi:protocatechuate 3,4-dioxygenase beta subunit